MDLIVHLWFSVFSHGLADGKIFDDIGNDAFYSSHLTFGGRNGEFVFGDGEGAGIRSDELAV